MSLLPIFYFSIESKTISQNYAFSECKALQDLTIGIGVIGDYAFNEQVGGVE